MRTWVSSPREKSKISSLSSLRMTMEFSHNGSLVLEAATMSGMKVGHLCGQSCFNTYSSNVHEYIFVQDKLQMTRVSVPFSTLKR